MILKEVISTSKELDDSPCRYSERIQNGVGKMGDDAFGVWHWTLLQSWKLLIKSEVVSANDCFLSLFPHFSHLKVLILLAPLHGCSLLSCREVSSAQNRLSAGSMLRLRRRGPDLNCLSWNPQLHCLPGEVGGAQEVTTLSLLLPQKPCLLHAWTVEREVSFLSPSSLVLWLMGKTTQKLLSRFLCWTEVHR